MWTSYDPAVIPFSLVLNITIFLILLFVTLDFKKSYRQSSDSHSHSHTPSHPHSHSHSSPSPSPSPSPSISSRPKRTYDVFLSFRGEDTRNNFVGHLYKSLDQFGIYTFKDDQKLEKGKTVAPELLKSIQESRFSIVILSQNYATSRWCLDELIKIIQCMEEFGQIVVPIFYNVDPSDVRNQTGSFKKAFDQHEKSFKKENKELLDQWREALRMVGSISGLDSRASDESVLIEEIVRVISNKLFSESSDDDSNLVGMSYHMQQWNSLLRNDGSNEVMMIGIWGMGGVGKTTISKALYNRYSLLYDGRCYMGNVKDNFQKHGASFLQQKLLSEIFLDRNLNIHALSDSFNVVKERLSRKKVFIVLDDVDNIEQLQALVNKLEWFGPGSRIIITTRDRHLLISHGVNPLYDVRGLTKNEAFQLFSQYAFKQDIPTSDYLELSYQFVSYTKGLPLALKVLGSFLHMKTIDEWASELNKLKRILNPTIQRVLKISFDELDDEQKDIFLDIACFFKFEGKDTMIDIWKSCGFSPETGLRVLVDKSLITISDNKLMIHDLLRELGWEVVRQQCIKEPGERSRLWLPEDVRQVFKYNTGTKNVEGIFFDTSKTEEMELTPKAFKKMFNLRLLNIFSFGFDSACVRGINKLHLPQGLEGLSHKLSYLHWRGYPLKSWPCNFQMENLVELSMPFSDLEQPWEGKMNMQNLKILELRHCHNLKDSGDLSLARNLEKIIFEDCSSLQEIHPSIQYLTKLTILVLRRCKNLKSLPYLPKNIKNLVLESTSIEELPQSGFQHSNQLERLDLDNCKFLLNLPSWLTSLNSLTELTLSGCSKITELPENLGDLSCLVDLFADGIGIDRLPSSLFDLRSLERLILNGYKGKDSALMLSRLLDLHSLKLLRLSNCNLVELPEGLLSLTHLLTLDLSRNNFEKIDASLEPLSNLESLDLRECKMLRSIVGLPSNIIYLYMNDCISLEIVSSSTCKYDGVRISDEDGLVINFRSFLNFTNCFKLNKISERNLMSDVLNRLQVDVEGYKFDEGLSVVLCYPGSEIPEWLTHQNEGSSLAFQMEPRMNSELVGFIVCAVLASEDCCHFDAYGVECKVNLTKSDGSLLKCRPIDGGMCLEKKSYVNSDHVWFGYFIGFRGYRDYKEGDIFTNCVMDFSISSPSYLYPQGLDCCYVKRCGARPVHLVYCEEQEKWKMPICL